MSDDTIEYTVPAAATTLQPTSRWLEVNVSEDEEQPQWERANIMSETWVDGRTLRIVRIASDGRLVQIDGIGRMRLVAHSYAGGTVDMRIGTTPSIS